MVRKSAVPFVYGRVYMKGGQIRLLATFLLSVRSVGRSSVGRPAGRSVGRARACDSNWLPRGGLSMVVDMSGQKLTRTCTTTARQRHE